MAHNAMYEEKFGRDLTTAEMKMCRMSLGITGLDHIGKWDKRSVR